MKDYGMIVAAIETAEKTLKLYNDSCQKEFNAKSDNVLDMVANYVHTILSDAHFPTFDIRFTVPYVDDSIPYGEMHLTCRKNSYIVNREHYSALLGISSNDSVMRIYFNDYGYTIENNHAKNPTLMLCYHWKKLKAKIQPTIDKALEIKIQATRRELEKINTQKSIIDNFEI